MKKQNLFKLFTVPLLIIILLISFGCKPLTCIDFEDPPLHKEYMVYDKFMDSGYSLTVLPFMWSNSNMTHDGFAKIENNTQAGGSGQDIQLNNVNLGFKINSAINKLTLSFGEYGGNLNININGDFQNFENFADINGTTIGGVNIAVINGHGNDKGKLILTGEMKEFAFEDGKFSLVIGGQELWIDDVCPFN